MPHAYRCEIAETIGDSGFAKCGGDERKKRKSPGPSSTPMSTPQQRESVGHGSQPKRREGGLLPPQPLIAAHGLLHSLLRASRRLPLGLWKLEKVSRKRQLVSEDRGEPERLAPLSRTFSGPLFADDVQYRRYYRLPTISYRILLVAWFSNGSGLTQVKEIAWFLWLKPSKTGAKPGRFSRFLLAGDAGGT